MTMRPIILGEPRRPLMLEDHLLARAEAAEREVARLRAAAEERVVLDPKLLARQAWAALMGRAEAAEAEVARLTRERDEARERGDMWSREYDRAEEARWRAVARADRADSQLALAMAWGAEACELIFDYPWGANGRARYARSLLVSLQGSSDGFAFGAALDELASAARDEGAAQVRAAAVALCREREAHARRCAAKYGPHSAAGAYEEDRAQAFEAAADAIEALPTTEPT